MVFGGGLCTYIGHDYVQMWMYPFSPLAVRSSKTNYINMHKVEGAKCSYGIHQEGLWLFEEHMLVRVGFNGKRASSWCILRTHGKQRDESYSSWPWVGW